MNFSDFNIDIPPGSSGEVRTTCPECSPTRKKSREKCLAVNADKGTWFCQHCGWTGGLGNNKPYTRPKYNPAPKLPENVTSWFKKRGIPESVLIKNKIGYGQSFSGKKGIQFPYFKGGKVVNIKHRTNDKRFRQEKDAEKCLYRFDVIAEGKMGSLIITEGEIDALSFNAAGFEYVASIPDGAPAPGTKNFRTKFDFLKSAEKIISRYDKVILAVDNDEPGKVAEQELARRIGFEKCYRVEYPKGCKDANDVLVKFGKEKLQQVVKETRPFPINGLLSTLDQKDKVLELYNRGVNKGLGTGWEQLDGLYTVRPCEMTIITGVPSSGKSNWLDSLMINLAIYHDWSFAVFSPENWPTERHIQTLLEKLVQKPFSVNRYNARMSQEQMLAGLRELDDHFHFIVPKNEFLSIENILKKAKIAIFRYGVKGIVIDPWNEVEHNFKRLREDQYLSQELTRIRQFARQNRVHIWVVAHPQKLTKNGLGEYPVPTMYDISGGAHWRNKADNGLCIHRPDYTTNETVVYIQKIRFREVGQVGETSLEYDRDTGVYR